MSVWTVRATIGTLTLEHVRVPVPDPDADPPLPQLVSLRVNAPLDDRDGGWPRTTDVPTGQLVFLVADAADAAAINATTEVVIEYETGGVVVFRYFGRASDPVMRPDELGMLVTVETGGLVADLAGYTAGAAAYPAEAGDVRVLRMLTETGAPTIVGWDREAIAPEGWETVEARAAAAGSLLDLTTEVLRSAMYWVEVDNPVTGETYNDYSLAELAPNVFGDEWLGNFRVDPIAPRSVSTAPLLLTVDGGVWSVTADAAEPATAAVVVDAADVAFDAQWARRKGEVPNTVEVVYDGGDSVVTVTNAGAGEARDTYRRESILSTAAAAGRLAAELLPPRIGPTSPMGWQPDKLTVLLDWTADGWWPGQLRDVIAVAGIPERHHPEAVSWWVGVITELELTVAEGSAKLDVQLAARPTDPGPDSVTFDDVATEPTLTLASLDPSVTFDRIADARLI